MDKHEQARQKIRDGMDANGLSINQLSRDANTDVSTLSKFLRGKCGMGAKTIEKILATLSDQGQSNPAEPSNSSSIIDVSLDKLRPSPDNPRKTFDAQSIDDLAASIARQGLLQNLIVRKSEKDDGHFEILGGERRFRALKLLAGQGKWDATARNIPAQIRKADEAANAEISIIENLQRVDVSRVEEAAAIHRLHEEFGRPAKDIAEQISKSLRYVQQSIKIDRDTTPQIKAAFEQKEITFEQTRFLSSCPAEAQAVLHTAIVEAKDQGNTFDFDDDIFYIFGEYPRASYTSNQVIEAYKGPQATWRNETYFFDLEQIKKLDAEHSEKQAAQMAKLDEGRGDIPPTQSPGDIDPDAPADPKASARHTQPQLVAARHIKTAAIQTAAARADIEKIIVLAIIGIWGANSVKLSIERTLNNDISVGQTALAKSMEGLLEPLYKKKYLAKSYGGDMPILQHGKEDKVIDWLYKSDDLTTIFTKTIALLSGSYTDYDIEYGDTPASFALAKFVEAKVPTIPMSAAYLKRFTIASLNRIALDALPKATNLDDIPDGKSDLIDYLVENASPDWRPPEFEFGLTTTIAGTCAALMEASE